MGQFYKYEEVLRHVDVENVALIDINENRLCWLGHVCWMEDDRPAIELLYYTLLAHGSCARRPKLRLRTFAKCLEVWLFPWTVALSLEEQSGLPRPTDVVCVRYNMKKVRDYKMRKARQREKRTVDISICGS
mgnify:CR=1 FL=1